VRSRAQPKKAKPLPGGGMQTMIGVLTRGDEVEVKWNDAPTAGGE
jgi:hypothetical protein